MRVERLPTPRTGELAWKIIRPSGAYSENASTHTLLKTYTSMRAASPWLSDSGFFATILPFLSSFAISAWMRILACAAWQYMRGEKPTLISENAETTRIYATILTAERTGSCLGLLIIPVPTISRKFCLLYSSSLGTILRMLIPIHAPAVASSTFWSSFPYAMCKTST